MGSSGDGLLQIRGKQAPVIQQHLVESFDQFFFRQVYTETSSSLILGGALIDHCPGDTISSLQVLARVVGNLNTA